MIPLVLLAVLLPIVIGVVVGTRTQNEETASKVLQPPNGAQSPSPTFSPTIAATGATIAPSPQLFDSEACQTAIGPLVVDQPAVFIDPTSSFESTLSCAGVMVTGGTWLNITGGDEVLRASTCAGSSDVALDTQILIYTGSCENLQCVAANDDFCGSRSSVSWLARKGVDYFIFVHGYGEDTFSLTVGYETNGECDASIPLNVSSSEIVVGSTRATDRSVNILTCDFLPAEDGAVWYSVVGTGSWMQASTCNSVTNFNARLNVLLEDCRGCQVFRDSSCGLGSIISWQTEPGVEYRVLVFKSDLRSGSIFGLTVTEFDLAENDACETATFLPLGTETLGSTFTASTDESLRQDCLGGDVSHPGVWYRIRGNGRRLIATTCFDDTDFGSVVSVFTGVCGRLQCAPELSEQFCGGRGSTYWDSVAGLDYLVLVHGNGSDGENEVGRFKLRIDDFVVEENDDCEKAENIEAVGLTYLGSNFAATIDDVVSCDSVGSLAPGVWYSITPNRTFNAVASTCSSQTSYDTKVSVYEGSCDLLACVATDDNSCGFQSSVVWRATQGVTYFIYVHGRFASSTGDFALLVDEYSPEVANDFCEDAIEFVPGDSLVTSSTLTATFDSVDQCDGVENTAAGVWYRVEGTGKNIRASLCHAETTFNSALSLFSGNCTYLDCVAARDDSPECGTAGASFVSWISTPGITYYLLVHGSSSRSGTFGLSVEEPEPAVENDFCVTAQSVEPSGIPVQGSTVGATLDSAPICTNVPVNRPGVWYVFAGTGERLIASTCLSPGDLNTRISVFTGTCGDLACVRADDNGCFIKSRVVFDTTVGTSYYIFVHDADTVDGGGEFELVVDRFVPEQPNDYCSFAQQVSPDGTVTIGSTVGASFDDTGSCGTTVTGLSVWYLVLVRLYTCVGRFAHFPYLFPFDQGTGERLRADTCHPQTNFDSKISIFAGGCDDLQCIAGNDDGCGLKSSISWDTEAGTLYW